MRNKMGWSYDRTLDVAFWGGVSILLTLLLHSLGLCSCCLLLFTTLWLLTAGVCLIRASLRVDVKGKAVIVTGCDSGFGHALASRLDDLGFRVFACCLDSNGGGAQLLRDKSSHRLHVLQLDITDEEQVRKAVHDVRSLLQEGEVLWGLVNNAGVTSYGQIEWVPLSTYRRIAEVNILGFISVTKAFLPLVRRAKGRIVNVSSVAGHIGRSIMAPYTLTKFAMEGFSDCLRQEMKPWGVQVSIIQPGNFSAATNITTEATIAREREKMWESMDDVVKSDYGQKYFDSVVAMLKMASNSGDSDISPVLDTMEEALCQRFPRARYRPVDRHLFFKILAVVHLPEWLFDLLYSQPRQAIPSDSKDT